MYKIVFYTNKNGESKLYNELITLAHNSKNNKDFRIQLNQIIYYVNLLKNCGFNLPSNIIKHISKEIWELRPGNNRVLFFYYSNNTFVLLHMFRKKTNKTPRIEIDRAISEYNDFIDRYKTLEEDYYENMGRFFK